ncbi:MAG: 30S ribosomal protein S21 [Chloroflexi bacterium]|nr:30S ribosomal protein S21 [Chloroflexota bacterium]
MYVSLRDGETQEALLRRFQRSIQNSGLLREVKAKRFFVSNGEKARIAARKSAARHRRRARKEAGLEIGGPVRRRGGPGGFRRPGGPGSSGGSHGSGTSGGPARS